MLQRNRLKRGQASLLTWKNSLLIFLICFIFIIFLDPESAKGDSGSFAPILKMFEEDEKEDVCYLIYEVNGGLLPCDQIQKLTKDQPEYKLVTPYRYGHRFRGWYLNSNFTGKITHMTAEYFGNRVVYAKCERINDNQYNVENYKYESKNTLNNSTLLLKNVDYSFCDEISIPGMPETKEEDFLNQYVFSLSQIPQGMCFTEEFVLITSYSTEEECLGSLIVIERETGEHLVTLGMDKKSHLGGIAFDGNNVWVCNSEKKTLERISYDFIETMAYQNKGGVVDATDVVDTYPVKNSPSCITYYGGRLWVATHSLVFESKMVAYHMNSSTDELEKLSEYKIPSKVQGIAFDESGAVYLSTSYGRKASSYLKKYASVVSLATSPNKPEVQIEMPPCSEEVDIRDENIYVLFESAGEKYYEGTDGLGKSVSPIDRILCISLEEF